MGLIGKAKGLDDKFLGSSSSTRGFVFNTASGLHPRLTPVWFTVALACVIASVVALTQKGWPPAVVLLLVSAACAFMGYVCKGMPAAPRR